MYFCKLVVFTLVCTRAILSQSSDECSEAKTCGGCISNANCFWCSEATTESYKAKCFNKSSQSVKQQCAGIEDPNNTINKIQDDNIYLGTVGNIDNIVLVQPQEVKVRIRPGSSVPIKFRIGQSRQYPLDLYFLLDLSWSMENTTKTVAEKGREIIQGVKQFTGELRTGFGSFIEKNLPPFSSAYPENNCRKKDDNCDQPYSFIHKTDLSNLTAEQFKKDVLTATLGGNTDFPEATLDALMQAMVCKDRIKWRGNSRKIIIIATGGDFHYGLDGKLVGVLEPNDATCHLDVTGRYSHAHILDYPSVSHINYIAQTNSYVVIFMVTQEYQDIYTRLSKLVTGSNVGVLDGDAENVVKYIIESLTRLTSTIEVKAENVPSTIRVNLDSTCENKKGGGNDVTCNNVELGDIVDFEVNIRAMECSDTQQTILLKPVGLNQTLKIDVETICECPCESDVETNTPECSKHGGYACGLCECNDGYSGNKCECDESVAGGSDDANCRDDNGDICHNRGRCNCGICACNSPSQRSVWGRLCECDDFSCGPPGEDEELCSGRGECSCRDGKPWCKCNPEWSGEYCDCSSRKENCFSPYTNTLCSKNSKYSDKKRDVETTVGGQCECNSCECPKDEKGDLFSGDFCELFPNEIAPCKILHDCVECQAFGTGIHALDGPTKGNDGSLVVKCSEECTILFELEEVKNITDEVDTCLAINKNGCEFEYNSIYMEDGSEEDKKLKVYLHVRDGEKEKCADVYTMEITLGIFAFLLLLGIITVLLFLGLYRLNDARAYAKFLNEKENMKFPQNQNPLFQSPVSTFQNPMYGKGVTS